MPLLELLASYIDKNIVPLIPEEVSVGASGDLTPLSYVAAALIGERQVHADGEARDTGDVLKELGLKPHTLRPKEALALMNDPQFVEAARFLAQRSVREGGAEVSEQIAFAFELATTRPASNAELEVLMALYRDTEAEFLGDVAAAEQFLSIGDAGYDDDLNVVEFAALTVVTNTILNLDETITKT